MAHIIADSSDSRFPCATAKERAEGRGGRGRGAGGLVTIFEVYNQLVCKSWRLLFDSRHLRISMRPNLSGQGHLEAQQQRSQEPSLQWVEGLLSRKGVVRGGGGKFQREPCGVRDL